MVQDLIESQSLSPSLRNCNLTFFSNEDLIIAIICWLEGWLDFTTFYVSGNALVSVVRSNRVTALFLNATSGARFTKHLKPKIFLSAIQIVWHLRKS